jgi:hypothetical protein
MKLLRFYPIPLRYLIFLGYLLFSVVGPRNLLAQTDTNAAAPGNRWLLIVETSRAMQRRAEAAQQVAGSLIFSGMNGQMHAGDTLGIWTFNESLHTGRVPLQDWTPENKQDLARMVFSFLKSQKNEKDGRLNSVTTSLLEVVKDSEFITVVIISDGSSPISGTPFDAKINASFKEWQAQQKQSQMPFLTILRAKAGKITEYVVNTPPFPLELPPLPPELLVPPKAREIKPAPPVAKPVALPNLILSGRKPETSSTSTQSLAEATSPTKPEVIAEPSKPEPTPVSEPIINPRPETNTVAALAAPQTNAAPVRVEWSVPVQTASSVAPKAVSKPNTLWLLGLGVLAVCGGIGFFLIRRSRNSSGASLITRSLDRDRK